MKNSLSLFVAVCVSTFIAADSGFSATRAPSNEGRDYVNGARSLANWSIGANYETAEKDLVFDTFGTRAVKSTKAMAYIGYDALPWMTPYLTMGQSQTKIGFAQSQDGQLDYGLGLLLNMLDYEVADSFLLEDRVRVNGSVEYTRTSMAVGNDDMDLDAFDASLTIGLVNDLVGATQFIPESITLFGGPVYSTWMGPDIKGAQSSRDDFGFTIGLEMFYTRSVSMNIRANFLEHSGASAGINVHF